MDKYLQRGKVEITFDVYTNGKNDETSPLRKEEFHEGFSSIMSSYLGKTVLDSEVTFGEFTKI